MRPNDFRAELASLFESAARSRAKTVRTPSPAELASPVPDNRSNGFGRSVRNLGYTLRALLFRGPLEHGRKKLWRRIVRDVIGRKPSDPLPVEIPALEVLVVRDYPSPADPHEPVPHLSDSDSVVAMMCFDVAPGEIGYRRLVSKGLLLQHQNDLPAQLLAAEPAASKVEPKLERHVQTIVLALLARLTPAEIVNRVSGGGNQFKDLLDTTLSGIACFFGNPGSQPEPDQAEQNRLQNGFVVVVERAVDECVALETALSFRRCV